MVGHWSQQFFFLFILLRFKVHTRYRENQESESRKNRHSMMYSLRCYEKKGKKKSFLTISCDCRFVPIFTLTLTQTLCTTVKHNIFSLGSSDLFFVNNIFIVWSKQSDGLFSFILYFQCTFCIVLLQDAVLFGCNGLDKFMKMTKKNINKYLYAPNEFMLSTFL